MNDKFSEKLGAWLAEKREQAGITQVQIAEQMKCSKQRISNWEKGIRNMNAEDLVEYCKITNIDLLELATFFVEN